MKILKHIFNKKIGGIILNGKTISKIKLFQPEEGTYCSFEVS